MRRRLLIENNLPIKPIGNANYADICLVDNSTLDKLIVEADNYNLETFPIEQYTPIGVVVVPASHTDDSTARIISLASMDFNNPNNGNYENNISMAWGGFGYDITTLDNKTLMPLISNNNYEDLTTVQKFDGWSNLNYEVPEMSSDYYDNEFPNLFDKATCFGRNFENLSPSPYLTGGNKNEIYYTVNSSNICADINGKVNTSVILDIDNTVSTTWQTASTITNNTSSPTNTQPHTAAQCCWRYHTLGTNQGDWYLPSAGELGYLVARWKSINFTINKIKSFDKILSIDLLINNSYWSSTEFSSYYAMSISLYDNRCFIANTSKMLNYFVRAFTAI